MLSVAPPVLEFAKRFEEHAKGMVGPATLFEEFGFNYIGPIDGHDLSAPVPTLQNIRQRAPEGSGPIFLHVVTKKGQGYKLAEADPILYHGGQVRPGRRHPSVGQAGTQDPHPGLRRLAVRHGCRRQAPGRHHPGHARGLGHGRVRKAFPGPLLRRGYRRAARGDLCRRPACEGLKPVVAIYSTFLQRGYDQLIHDVALQNLPVVFALDRAGTVGADGATHAGPTISPSCAASPT